MLTAAHKPMKFMLVEDSEGDAYVFKLAMAQARLLNELVVFPDGRQALEHLMDPANANELPGIIFLDINMPMLSGFEVLKRLKADDRLRMIPVVVLTISHEEEDAIKSYDLGAVSFISKSIRAENLLDVVLATPGLDIMVMQKA